MIPKDEQPYKIPDNWRWTKLGNVCRFENGYAFKSDNFSEEIGVPVIRISNIFDDKVELSNCIKTTEKHIDKKFIIQNGDLLIAMSGATTGKNGIFNSSEIAYLNQRVGNIKIIDDKILLQKYRNFYIKEKTEEILRNAYGGAQPNISSNKICEMLIPLPPLDEQQRIVDIIENLFAKLDKAKALAQNIIDNYELRRSAILHKAFTGILTSNWRFNNKIDFDSWQNLLIKNIASIGSGGTPSRKNIKYYNGNIAWVKTGEIYWNKITKTEEYITLEALENSSARIYPVGTVLVAMYGQGLTRGRAAILGIESATNQAVCALQPLDNINNKFLYYFFMANYHNFRTKAFGTNQSNYSATVIGKLNINIPTIKEQKEIVRILDSLLAKEQQTKELAEQILQKIDLMKKIILSRAFCGELSMSMS